MQLVIDWLWVPTRLCWNLVFVGLKVPMEPLQPADIPILEDSMEPAMSKPAFYSEYVTTKSIHTIYNNQRISTGCNCPTLIVDNYMMMLSVLLYVCMLCMYAMYV